MVLVGSQPDSGCRSHATVLAAAVAIVVLAAAVAAAAAAAAATAAAATTLHDRRQITPFGSGVLVLQSRHGTSMGCRTSCYHRWRVRSTRGRGGRGDAGTNRRGKNLWQRTVIPIVKHKYTS